tara:strand:+ start:1536 stop:2015 length:480 start_codon:yes stop_codon:yes gene_type:complete
MKTEIWKDIKDYEGLYQVSNLGRVKSLKFGKERILSAATNATGYSLVALCNGKTKAITAHQLVAMAFLNHKPCGYKLVVDHINTIKTDNRLENLQVITHRQNCTKDKKGTSKYTGVHWCKPRNKWRAEIRINGKTKYLGSFKSELEASEAYQLKLETIK